MKQADVAGAKISLRGSQYHRYCVGFELLQQAQQAEAFGVSAAYISRLVRGQTEVTAEFIAGVLAALPERRFEDIFEVVLTAEMAEAS